MGLFSRLFKKKREVKELELGDLKTEISKKQSQIKDELKEQKQRIEFAKDELSDALKRLENPKLAEEKDQKIVEKVISNKDAYVKHTKHLLDEVEISEDITAQEITDFCSQMMQNFDDYGKKTVKNFQVAQYLMGEELVNCANKISALAKTIQMLLEYNKRLEKTEILGARIEALLKKEENKKTAEKRIGIEKDKLEEQEEGEKELEDELKLMEKSEDYKEYKKKEIEKEKKEKELQKIEMKIANFFSPLTKALRKYSKISLEPEMVDEYAEKPVETLLNDADFEIMGIIKKLEKNIDKLDIKKDKLQKTMQAINRISEESLLNLVTNHKYINSELKLVEDELSKFRIEEKIKEKKKEIEDSSFEMEEIKKRIKEIEEEKKIDLDKEKKEIERELI